MILDEIGDYLAANGVTPLYKARMADQPDNATCLYEYGGPPPIFSHDGEAWQNMRLQAVSRSPDYQTARSTAQQIYDLLNGQANTTINGGNYLWIAALQSPFALGPDQNLRHRVVTNFELVRTT